MCVCVCVCVHMCVYSCMRVRITGTVTVAAYTDMLYLFVS